MKFLTALFKAFKTFSKSFRFKGNFNNFDGFFFFFARKNHFFKKRKLKIFSCNFF